MSSETDTSINVCLLVNVKEGGLLGLGMWGVGFHYNIFFILTYSEIETKDSETRALWYVRNHIINIFVSSSGKHGPYTFRDYVSLNCYSTILKTY